MRVNAQKYWRLWVCLLVLNLLDCILTTALVNSGSVEASPIWSELHLWTKVPLALLLIMFVRSRWILSCATTGMALIVMWNSCLVYFQGDLW